MPPGFLVAHKLRPSHAPASGRMDIPESVEALQARHRKEQRDLVAKITQRKKSATKKTRKGVNDECDRLEHELKERQAQELAAITGGLNDKEVLEEHLPDGREEVLQAQDIEQATENLSLDTVADPSEPPLQNGTKKKQNRAKARLARRAAEQEALAAEAAEEAANLPDLREQERTRMKEHLGKHGLREKEIRADGHCLYAAIADQMETTGLGLQPRIVPRVNTEDTQLPAYKRVRYTAADIIQRDADDYVGFMEEPLEAYLQKIRETGEWGGHMELTALAKAYGVKIKVLHSDGRVDEIVPANAGTEEEREIWLGYYRHNFGLGEHYNSLRKSP